MTFNKEQAQARLSAIEDGLRTLNDEAAALRSIIEAPEKVEKKPLVQAKDQVGSFVQWGPAGYFASKFGSRNAFETRNQAEAYAEAINTLLDLRRQPGSEAAEDRKRQWWLDSSGEVADALWARMKLQRTCPMFESADSAIAAREAVGLDRILRMYNTLHGRGYE